MKRKLLTIGLIFVLVALMAPCLAFAQEDSPDFSLVFGGRIQSNTLFYMQGGVIVDTWEFVGGLGLNDSIWLGAHKYIVATDSISVFSGVELLVSYANYGKIMFTPALPIGFAFDAGGAVFVVESLILPAKATFAVDVLFAVSFLFKL